MRAKVAIWICARRFVDQLREDSYLGPEVVVKALENLIFKGNVDELVKKDANLLVDRCVRKKILNDWYCWC